MKIKKKTNKYTTIKEHEEIKKARDQSMQFELTPSALNHWEKNAKEKKAHI
ncbi:hypothetical protein LCGC14_0912500 [marine sediment metagenome]|uniref:Uncharacterized protein n=1 Tax=marine sediment metagenome TaxID=412755 RepID=A0A0F9RC23_9ZZZZ